MLMTIHLEFTLCEALRKTFGCRCPKTKSASLIGSDPQPQGYQAWGGLGVK